MNIKKLFCCSILSISSVFSYKLVGYWGQNSAGIHYPSDQLRWEKTLKVYCDGTYDTILLSFMHLFGIYGSIGLNFANHCDTSCEGKPFVLKCPIISDDIKYCQNKGVKIGISLGGAAGYYGFLNEEQAMRDAIDINNLLFSGKTDCRPFGDVILDELNLDIEAYTSIGYKSLVNKLKELNPNIIISTAQQSAIPDHYLQDVLDDGKVNYSYIQFYNNYNSVKNYPTYFNYKEWNLWANQKYPSNNHKLFLGIPADSYAANLGEYQPIDKIKVIFEDLYKNYPENLGGIMIWELSSAQLNVDGNNKHFGRQLKDIMNNISPEVVTTDSTDSIITETTNSEDIWETPVDDIIDENISTDFDDTTDSWETYPETSTETISETTESPISETTDCTKTITQIVIQTITQTVTDSQINPPIQTGECSNIAYFERCSGDIIEKCLHGTIIQVPCPIGTTCRMNNGFGYCDWK